MVALSSPWGRALIDPAIELFVAPSNANASDRNAGLSADLPLATLGAALGALNSYRGTATSVRVRLESGAYTWDRTLGPLDGGPWTIDCDGAGQPGDDGFVELRAPAAAAAGTGQRVVVDPVGGLTVNAFVGKTILILTGAAAGDRRQIHSNTATNIVPVRRFTAAVAVGDSFRIVESGAVITGPTAPYLAGSPPSIVGVGTPGNVYGIDTNGLSGYSTSTLLLANLRFQRPVDAVASSFWFAGSNVSFAGVEFRGTLWGVSSDAGSFVRAGCDLNFGIALNEFALPADLGMAPSRTAWAGWGLHMAETVGLPNFKNFAGFLTQLTTSTSAITRGVVGWLLNGGHLVSSVGTDFNGFWSISRSQVRIDACDALLPFSVTAVGGQARAAGIRVISGALLDASGLDVTITALGSGIVATGSESDSMMPLQGGTVSLDQDVRISAPYACVIAMTGGRVYWNVDPVAVVVPTAGEAIITQSITSGAPVAPSPTTFAALADGAVVVNPDGSGTILGRIT